MEWHINAYMYSAKLNVTRLVHYYDVGEYPPKWVP